MNDNMLLEERQTAGKRIKVYYLHNPGHVQADGRRNPNEEDMIQEMADKGYNFAGLIREHIPTSSYGWPGYWYLFIAVET